jgi:hypothetical protein
MVTRRRHSDDHNRSLRSARTRLAREAGGSLMIAFAPRAVTELAIASATIQPQRDLRLATSGALHFYVETPLAASKRGSASAAWLSGRRTCRTRKAGLPRRQSRRRRVNDAAMREIGEHQERIAAVDRDLPRCAASGYVELCLADAHFAC